ncbi:MAG: DUF2318 domain-containing protein [Chloroflexi bacterium]|nr:DUF2318 domain-containing protein [Chloroflexota bacterium]
MLEILVSTLKNALELAFLLAMLSAYLETTRHRGLGRPLALGALLALVATPILIYGMKSFLEREIAEGTLNLLAVLFTLGLIAGLGRPRDRQDGVARSGSDKNWTLSASVLAASFVLVVIRGLDIALIFPTVFAQNSRLPNSDLAIKLSAFILGLSIAALVGVTLRKVVVKVRPAWVASISILSLLTLAVQEAITTVQMMVVRGMVPLTEWLFRIIVPVINNDSAFYYALLVAACVLVLVAARQHRRQKPALQGLNPAQERKLRVASRRTGTLIGGVSGLLALVVLVDGASAVYANRQLSLSPATPVAPQGDVVMMLVDSVSDGTLRRFSYEASDGTVVRFLVVHKGSGVFGVGLDACAVCGPVGYRQEGKNVICIPCASIISIPTIGFPGGCNPVPLHYHRDGDSLVIPVEALEDAKRVFSQ